MSDTPMKFISTPTGGEYVPLTEEEIAQQALDAITNAEIIALRDATNAARQSAVDKIAAIAGLTAEEKATL